MPQGVPIALTAPATTSIAPAGWIAVATLLRPQGRRGELLAEPLTDLAGIFSAGRSVRLSGKDTKIRTLEEQWSPTGRNVGRIVLKLSGCECINDAEALAGRQVLVSAAEMPVLDADTFFVGDLVGCAFYDGVQPVGTIVDVEFPVGSDGRRLEDAATLLAVELNANEEPVLVPFVRAWLVSVDIAGRRVAMHLPEGLLGETDEVVGDDEGESTDAV